MASVLVCILLQAAHSSQGQTCPGDIDGDGHVTANDLAVLISIISGEAEAPALKERADVNGDGTVSAGDIPGLIPLHGEGCSAPTATPSARPTPSPTPTASPTIVTVSPTGSPAATATPRQTVTITPTPTATSTPKLTCVVLPAPFGITNGALTFDDCQQKFDKFRYTDVYTVAGSPGQAITVQVTATGSPAVVPYVAVADPDGQFIHAAGPPPIQFVVSTSQPYEISVTSAPSTPQQLGPYQLTVTQAPCPTPIALAIPSSLPNKTLRDTDCPDPGAPSIGTALNPAHLFTFQVPSVPMNIAIVMRQLAGSDVIPAFSVLNPDGIELVTQSNDFDCTTSDLLCAQTRFLALQPGKYTIIAAGGIGNYSLQLSSPTCKAKALSNIPSDTALTCPGQSDPGCAGTLSGDTSSTSCAAPLPIPGISDSAPADPSSPADLYTFTAAAGDVISVTMNSDDDAHLYLLGPAPGNQLIAQDDDSFDSFSDAQLAATLAQPGTYTIVAANNNALQPDDSAVNYTLLVQKCPVRGTVPFGTGVWLNQTFSDSECVGFGGIPYRTYSFTGTAGQFVAAGMTSTDVDAFIRMLAPDGSVVENNDDLLASSSPTDAQVNRILPANGTYFVEVSTNGGSDTVPFFFPPAFSVGAQTCPATTVTPGTINAAFTDADCQSTDGTPFNVFAFTPPAVPSAASVVPPPGIGCVVALLAEGAQTPDSGCTTDMMDFPTLSNRTYGFIIAATDPATRGPYAAALADCPLSLLTFGNVGSGSLAPSDCHAADGTPTDWFLLKAAADLVWFNQGMFGAVTTSFAAANVLTDAGGSTPLAGFLNEDPTQMYSFGTDLAALLRVAGQTPADHGTYSVSIDSAWLRQ